MEASPHRPSALARRRRMLHGSRGGSPADRLRRHRRTAIIVLIGFATVIVPWTLHLAYTLPARHVTEHWDVAWVGFDVFEAVAAVATLAALFRQSRRLAIIAASAGTLLLCDAWFDVATAQPGSELRWAIVSAVFAEVPLACLFFWLALDAQQLEAVGGESG